MSNEAEIVKMLALRKQLDPDAPDIVVFSEKTEDARLADIRDRRSRADIEATHLRFPDELAPRWQDVDVLLEENRQLRNEVADLRAACQHYTEQAKKAAEILLGVPH